MFWKADHICISAGPSMSSSQCSNFKRRALHLTLLAHNSRKHHRTVQCSWLWFSSQIINEYNIIPRTVGDRKQNLEPEFKSLHVILEIEIHCKFTTLISVSGLNSKRSLESSSVIFRLDKKKKRFCWATYASVSSIRLSFPMFMQGHWLMDSEHYLHQPRTCVLHESQSATSWHIKDQLVSVFWSTIEWRVLSPV